MLKNGTSLRRIRGINKSRDWLIDSVGANIFEGHGRHSYQNNQRFVKFARGSLN
ncbi:MULTISPECIES: four helix bundle protein [unclassified Microcoleus]|uniref:four helix bundle protein n=1 Tax=unclassified Microcoleus TaxID=2642155 RepID=UPI002FCF6036